MGYKDEFVITVGYHSSGWYIDREWGSVHDGIGKKDKAVSMAKNEIKRKKSNDLERGGGSDYTLKIYKKKGGMEKEHKAIDLLRADDEYDVSSSSDNQRVFYVEPYSFQDDTVSAEQIVEQFPSLKPMFENLDEKRVSGGDPLSPLTDTGYRAIAFTPPVKYAYYNEEKNIVVADTEGDVKVVENPTDDYLNDMLSYYPEAEVTGYGERFDKRFPNQN